MLVATPTVWAAGPMELNQFEVEALGNRIILTWEVSAEPAEGEYILERSLDGVSWRGFRRVTAEARRGEGQTYQATTRISAAFKYYRLKFLPRGITEPNARILGITFSDLDCANVFLRAIPKPQTGDLELHYTLDRDKSVLARAFDRTGQEIWTQALPSGEAGVYDVALDWSSFERGNYLLVFTQMDNNLNLSDLRIEY